MRVVAPTSVNGGRSSVSVRAAAPWPNDDVEPEVLERRVEDLLGRAGEPVDLVDEEHVARLERREHRRDVLLLERRAGDRAEAHAELLPDDLRERRLAETGRAGEQDVVERLAPRLRRVERDRELLLDALLADEVVEPARAERAFGLLVLGVEDGSARGRPMNLRSRRGLLLRERDASATRSSAGSSGSISASARSASTTE